MTTDMQKKIERTHDALFGVIGEPDKSLMVQILQTVKEVKAIRMSHDKIVPQVQENTRTHKTQSPRTSRLRRSSLSRMSPLRCKRPNW